MMALHSRTPAGSRPMARALLATALAALAATTGTPAPAQQLSDAGEAMIPDIIVTARKREESLQDVPLAISAFTADTIEREGFRSIADIALQSPGISFRQAFGRDADRPVIRGMSNIQGAANVGFFIDGIFVTGSVASLNLDNLERVEIIRGPQAALFGRNTFAGAVNFITRRPDNTLSAQAKGTLGEDGLREVSGFVSGPLIQDRLFAQLDGKFYEFGGQYDNAVDPDDKLGRQKSLSFGGTLVARPTDSFELVGRIYYIKDEDGFYPIMRANRVLGQTLPVARQLVINNGLLNCALPQPIGLFNPAQRPLITTRTRGYRCGPLETPELFALNTAQFRAAGFPNNLEREEWRASLRMSLDINDWEFVAIGAYNDRERLSATDQDYSDVRAPAPVIGAFETIDFGGARDWSGEFKIVSPQRERVRVLAGLYVYDEKSKGDAFTANLNLGINRAFQVGDDPSLIVRNPVFSNKTRNWAVFGQLAFDLTEALTVTAEARYQEDRLSIAGESRATVAGQQFVRAIAPEATFTNFLPRFTVDWQATPGFLVYGVVAKGNKPGGFNTGVFNAVYDDTQVAQLVAQGLDTFDEEEAWTYEIGAKTQWLDRRLTINLAAFYIDWKNQQLTNTVQIPRRDGALGSVSFTTNVGKSEVKGVEIESSARLAPWLSVRVGYAYTDARIKDFISDDQADLYITAEDLARLDQVAPLPLFQAPGSPGYADYLLALAAAAPARNKAVAELLALRGNAAGNHLPRVPEHQLSAGAQFDFPVSDDVRGFFNTNLALESRRFTQVDNLLYAPDSVLVNLRGGIEWKGLSLTAFLTNALNDRTPADILRYIDPQQTLLRPALRPGEATAVVGGRNVSSTNLRDFAVTAPRLRNFGVTLLYRFSM
jgi:iron complex outermembrane receptor protein